MIQEEDYITNLKGEFEDQAALYGVLRRIQDLGMSLVSINPVEDEDMVLKSPTILKKSQSRPTSSKTSHKKQT